MSVHRRLHLPIEYFLLRRIRKKERRKGKRKNPKRKEYNSHFPQLSFTPYFKVYSIFLRFVLAPSRCNRHTYMPKSARRSKYVGRMRHFSLALSFISLSRSRIVAQPPLPFSVPPRSLSHSPLYFFSCLCLGSSDRSLLHTSRH